MAMMMMNKVQREYFDAMVDGRIKVYAFRFGQITVSVGEAVSFWTNDEKGNEILYLCKITRIKIYNSIMKYVDSEGWENVIPWARCRAHARKICKERLGEGQLAVVHFEKYGN